MDIQKSRLLLKAMFFQLTVIAITADCTKVINLALGLKMDANRVESLRSDCCNYAETYVRCDGTGAVEDIIWNFKNLTGTINATAIPSKLNVFYANNN